MKASLLDLLACPSCVAPLHLRDAVDRDGEIESGAQLKQWAVLDTFDMLAPAHDHPQSVETLRRWFAEAGFSDVEVERAGLVVGRGTRPASAGSPAREPHLTERAG